MTVIKPYLAILVDSFREALASRVLWVLLVLITLLLLALAPVRVYQEESYQLQTADMDDSFGLVAKLQAAAEEEGAGSPQRTVLDALPEKVQSEVRQFKLEDKENPFVRRAARGVVGDVVEALQKVTGERLLYTPEQRSAVALTEEERELAERAEPTAAEKVQLNRRFLESTFPGHIERSIGKQMRVSYTPAFDYPLPTDEKTTREFIERVIAIALDFVLGVVGVIVAILVTANIIPTTFNPGAVDLLLSKPVNRAAMFLTKFFGGCAFILLCGAYLLAGFWLVAGVRLDLWNPSILYSIPIFLFLFVIYYSVSALAGVIWRNAIICVVMTILFWLVCFTVGASKGTMDALLLAPYTLKSVTRADDGGLIVGTAYGKAYRSAGSGWQELLASPEELIPGSQANARRMAGPVAVAEPLRVFAVKGRGDRFSYADETDDWRTEQGAALPFGGVDRMFATPDGRLLLVARANVHLLPPDAAMEGAKEAKFMGLNLGNRQNPALKAVGPDKSLILGSDYAVGYDPAAGRLAYFDRGAVTVLESGADGRFVQTAQRTLELDRAVTGMVQPAGDHLVLVLEKGEVRVLDASTLEETAAFVVDTTERPTSLAASPDGRFAAAAFVDGRLWLHDADTGAGSLPRVGEQGQVGGVGFDADGHLLVTSTGMVVHEYALPDLARVGGFTPELTTAEKVYWWLVHPIYTVFPKPGEMSSVITYLITDQQSFEAPDQGQGSDARIKIDVWTPVVSNAIFVVVMLTLTSLYVTWKNF